MGSLPAWGVWIEIWRGASQNGIDLSLPAWGVWIEIALFAAGRGPAACHSPHGECGLKSTTDEEAS